MVSILLKKKKTTFKERLSAALYIRREEGVM
jgi:hypothetical protein